MFSPSLKANEWSPFVPDPCSTSDTSQWSEPRYFTFCPDTSKYDLLPSCKGLGCCFTMVYYERFAHNPDGTLGRYEFYYAGLFFEKNNGSYRPECEQCSNPYQILWATMADFLQYRSLSSMGQTTFADSLGLNSEVDTLINVYYTAKCYSINEIECKDDSSRCCKEVCRPSTLWRNNKRYVSGFIYRSQNKIFNGPPCPQSYPPCVADCDSMVFAPVPNFCEIEECNYGDFFPLSSDPITVPGCPETCKIKIYYWYREVSGPNCPPFIDFMLDHVEFFGDCSGCTMSIQDLYSYIVSWLLKYGGIELQIGQCYDYYRTFNAMCWETRENKLFTPCWDNTYCCWSVYRVCRLGEETYTYEKLYGSNPPTDTCGTVSRPCVYVCDLLPSSPKIGIEDNLLEKDINMGLKAKVIPNPNDGTAIISVNGSDNGKFILKLYNNNGDELYTFNFEKKSYNHSIQLNLSDYTSGKYLYKIYIDKKCIIDNSFVIVK